VEVVELTPELVNMVNLKIQRFLKIKIYHNSAKNSTKERIFSPNRESKIEGSVSRGKQHPKRCKKHTQSSGFLSSFTSPKDLPLCFPRLILFAD
jgi:hypothetical protein